MYCMCKELISHISTSEINIIDSDTYNIIMKAEIVMKYNHIHLHLWMYLKTTTQLVFLGWHCQVKENIELVMFVSTFGSRGSGLRLLSFVGSLWANFIFRTIKNIVRLFRAHSVWCTNLEVAGLCWWLRLSYSLCYYNIFENSFSPK